MWSLCKLVTLDYIYNMVISLNVRKQQTYQSIFKCNKQNPPPSKIDKNIGGAGGWSENSAGLVLWVGVLWAMGLGSLLLVNSMRWILKFYDYCFYYCK